MLLINNEIIRVFIYVILISIIIIKKNGHYTVISYKICCIVFCGQTFSNIVGEAACQRSLVLLLLAFMYKIGQDFLVGEWKSISDYLMYYNEHKH